MFGYFKRNRAKVVVQSIMPGLRDGIQVLSACDRAATLALVNAMMEVSADQWGQGVLRAPSRLTPDAAAQAVMALASHHANLVRDGLGRMQDRGMEDIGYAHAMRETRATELLIATLGSCLYDGPKTEVQESWRMLWRARGSAEEGVAALRQYGRHAKVDPVPRSRRRLQGTPEAELLRLASSVPPFLQPRKPAAESQPSSAKPSSSKPSSGKSSPARPSAGKSAQAKSPEKAPASKAPMTKPPAGKPASATRTAPGAKPAASARSGARPAATAAAPRPKPSGGSTR